MLRRFQPVSYTHLDVYKRQEENGKKINKFYPLNLEMNKVNALTLSWTLVHPINEESPFYKFTKEDFESAEGEVIVYLKTFDDLFSTTVTARSSYTFKAVSYTHLDVYKRQYRNNFA